MKSTFRNRLITVAIIGMISAFVFSSARIAAAHGHDKSSRATPPATAKHDTYPTKPQQPVQALKR